MRDYKSPKKTVGGNEGDKCHYPTRLDTYRTNIGNITSTITPMIVAI